MKNEILLTNNMISCDFFASEKDTLSDEQVATIIYNLAYYGFCPSLTLINKIKTLSVNDAVSFLEEKRKTLSVFFSSFVSAEHGMVYKNFPSEVLSKSEGEYFFNQFLIYMGVDRDFVVDEKIERESVKIDLSTLKILEIADENSLSKIYDSIVNKKVKMTPLEQSHIAFLTEYLNISKCNISEFPFKANGFFVAEKLMSLSKEITANNASDVIRFAKHLMSERKVEAGAFKFNRAERKVLLKMLCDLSDYKEDLAMRKGEFKRLMKALRPGDYSWAKKASTMYDLLYNDKVKSFNSQVEMSKDPIGMMASRPGVLLRNFHRFYKVNPAGVVSKMIEVLPYLTVGQLLKFKKYVSMINDVPVLIAKPSSSWNKAKLLDNKKVKISLTHIAELTTAINAALKEKLDIIFPDGVMKGEDLDKITLPSNDQEISIGRGTVIDIPENIKFLRTATFWRNENSYDTNSFFDNSFNMIAGDDSEIRDTSACWDTEQNGRYSVFSGDSVIYFNNNKMASQVFDINLDLLKKDGFKYLSWNVLSYSCIKFSDQYFLSASMQFIEDQNNGEVFEPSRAQLNIELKDSSMFKYIAYIDIQDRKLVLFDVSFSELEVSTASRNTARIKEITPALLDHLKMQPTVADLVENIKDGSVPFLYSDENQSIKEGKAFVFSRKNQDNEFDQIDVQSLLE